MGDTPVVADNKPKKTEVKKGEDYYWCACEGCVTPTTAPPELLLRNQKKDKR